LGDTETGSTATAGNGVAEWLKNDELFRRMVQEGHSWQEYAAERIREAGHRVVVPPLTIRENVADRDRWIDTKDILIERFPFEVKSRNVTFSSPEDFPYPDIIVDTVRGYDAKVQKPLGYLYVSRETGCMMWTWGRTPESWEKRLAKDNVRNLVDLFYFAPKTAWMSFPAILPVLSTLTHLHTADIHAMTVSGKE